ncbi:MAG: hypothetical protein KF901_34080 [Myxococcales bacterium]|nr:hypothetical protein [Myxococcales bacterium]
MNELRGTKLSLVAPRAEADAALARLLARGRRHALGQRVGCAVTSAGLALATLLLALGHFAEMALVGLVVLAAYWIASALDPELADDRRVKVTRALLAGLPIDDAAPLTLELELMAYDADAPDEKRPMGRGKLALVYRQRWLTLGFLAKGDVRVLLEVDVEAATEEDGIAVERADEHELARVRCEEDGRPSTRRAREVRGWRAEGDAFRVGGLATPGQLLALVESALGSAD